MPDLNTIVIIEPDGTLTEIYMQIVTDLIQPLILLHKQVNQLNKEINSIKESIQNIKTGFVKIHQVRQLNELYLAQKDLKEKEQKLTAVQAEYDGFYTRFIKLINETGAQDFKVTINNEGEEETYRVRINEKGKSSYRSGGANSNLLLSKID